MLKLNAQLAKDADNINAGIKETGKYIGTITRAEKLVSKDKGTLGLGLSIKTDDGLSADYLDIWHTSVDGSELSGLKTVNAILCCTKTLEAQEGPINVERWDNTTGKREKTSTSGYPGLMGKRIGLLLQKQLETNKRTGKEVERVGIFAVFNAETHLTASEMYAKKTNPERLSQMLTTLMARPVKDNRKKPSGSAATAHDDGGFGHADQEIPDDDIPF